MIYLLDSDQKGTDSIQQHIDAKTITYIPVPSQDAFERAVVRLLPLVYREKDEWDNFKCKPQERDVVILDTLNAMTATTRLDAKLGSDPMADLMKKRELYLKSDKDKSGFNTWGAYNWGTDSVMRRLKNLKNAGARIITTSHEADQFDPTSLTKKRAPSMNPDLWSSLLGATSDIFRLTSLSEPIMREDGVTVRIPARTRKLYLANSEEHTAKFNVRAELALTIPDYMYLPLMGGMHKVIEKLGKHPEWLHIYGPPGAGKTTLACSEADSKKPAKNGASKEVVLDATPAG